MRELWECEPLWHQHLQDLGAIWSLYRYSSVHVISNSRLLLILLYVEDIQRTSVALISHPRWLKDVIGLLEGCVCDWRSWYLICCVHLLRFSPHWQKYWTVALVTFFPVTITLLLMSSSFSVQQIICWLTWDTLCYGNSNNLVLLSLESKQIDTDIMPLSVLFCPFISICTAVSCVMIAVSVRKCHSFTDSSCPVFQHSCSLHTFLLYFCPLIMRFLRRWICSWW